MMDPTETALVGFHEGGEGDTPSVCGIGGHELAEDVECEVVHGPTRDAASTERVRATEVGAVGRVLGMAERQHHLVGHERVRRPCSHHHTTHDTAAHKH